MVLIFARRILLKKLLWELEERGERGEKEGELIQSPSVAQRMLRASAISSTGMLRRLLKCSQLARRWSNKN
jgi:hypothetical protein